MGARPMRTCVGCRSLASKEGLLRVTQNEAGALVFDLHGIKPGRGAYLCMSAMCLIQALKRGSFGRAFRKPTSYTDPRDLARHLAEILRQETKTLLASGQESGRRYELPPWGFAPTETHAWKLAGWLLLASELETNPPTIQSKKRGDGQGTMKKANLRHEGREDGESSGV
jgi:predicted RNA-binding protein YlxR (DUF448 family)